MSRNPQYCFFENFLIPAIFDVLLHVIILQNDNKIIRTDNLVSMQILALNQNKNQIWIILVVVSLRFN